MTARTWSHIPRWIGARLRAATLVFVALALAPALVSAHVALVAATPVPGSTVGQAPKIVRIRFDQEPDPQFSQISLLDTSGRTVAGGPATRSASDPTTIETAIAALPAGVYTVAWQALAPDGHLSKGNYSFTLSAAPGPAAPAEPQPISVPQSATPTVGTNTAQTGNPSVVAVLVRWLRYLALGALVGACGFATLIFRPALAGMAEEERDALWTRLVRHGAPIAFGGAVAFLLLHIATLIVQTATVADEAVTAVRWETVRRLLFDTEYGGVWRVTAMVAVGAIAALTFCLPARRASARLGIVATARPPAEIAAVPAPPAPAVWPWNVSLGVSLLLVATLTLSSHAIESQHEPLLALMADAAHLGAMGLWFGGLLVLLALLPRLLLPLDDAARDDLRATVVERFSALALGSVALLIATGLYAMTLHTTRATILGTSYGQTLLIKHALIVPLLAVAALNLRVIRPRLRTDARARRWLPRALGAEAALGFAVLLVTATLAQLPPAHPLNGTNAAAADPRLATALPASPPLVSADRPDADLSSGPQSVEMIHGAQVMVVLQTTTGKDGSTLSANLIDPATVEDHTDDTGNHIGVSGKASATPLVPQQLGDVQRVTALVTFAGADLGQTAVPLAHEEDGWYRAKGMFFPIKGEWNIQIVVRRANIAEDARLNFTFVSDPARYTLATNAPATTAQTPAATSGLRWPRLLPNGYLGGMVALVGVGLLVLTRTRRFRGTLPARTLRIYRGWSVGALLVGLIAFGYFSTDVTPTADRANPLPNTTATLALGQQVFAQNCAVCHGTAGKGDGPLAAQLRARPANLSGSHVTTHTDGDLYWWVSHGIPGSGMPAFSGTLSDQDIWAAIRYIRTLNGK